MQMDYSIDNDWLMSWEAAGLEVGGGVAGWLGEKYYMRQAKIPGTLDAIISARSVPSASRYQPNIIRGQKKIAATRVKSRHFTSLKKASLGLGYISLAAFGFSLFDSLVGSSGQYTRSKRYNPSMQNTGYSEESYFDSRAAFTQRQRALMVIHNSQLGGTRAAFGQEAQFLHY